MRTEEEIKKKLELIKYLKKQLANLKYPCIQSAVNFIQLQAQEEILEWISEE